MKSETIELSKLLNQRLRAQEQAVSKLEASILAQRGGATSLRCGICKAARSASDVRDKTFTHYRSCPAAALEEVRSLLEDPELEADIRSHWAELEQEEPQKLVVS